MEQTVIFLFGAINYMAIEDILMGDETLFVMLAMLGVLAIFLVPCGILCVKLGKAKTYALGLGIASVALMISFFLPQGPGIAIYILAATFSISFYSRGGLIIPCFILHSL